MQMPNAVQFRQPDHVHVHEMGVVRNQIVHAAAQPAGVLHSQQQTPTGLKRRRDLERLVDDARVVVRLGAPPFVSQEQHGRDQHGGHRHHYPRPADSRRRRKHPRIELSFAHSRAHNADDPHRQRQHQDE